MKCPGQDMQFWKPGDIYEVDCPGCGRTVEFFKDDTARRCGHCGHRFANPKMDFGCAAYCPYAEQCLGDLPPEVAAQQEDLLKDRVAVAVKRHLKTDFKRIGHITRRARHAERLGRDAGANLPVVLISALLWDLDEVSASKPATVARGILEQLKAPLPLIEQVCAIIAMRGTSANRGNSEYQVIVDADRHALEEKAATAG
jgi:hypothetical protein